MIDVGIARILEKENLQEALNALLARKDGCGTDGMMLSELPNFLDLNPDWFESYREKNGGRMSSVQAMEILSEKGKKRIIYLLNSLDRLIGRLICQAVQPELERYLSEGCHSYRENYGVSSAVFRLKQGIEQGRETLVNLDIKDFFETISHELLREKMEAVFSDRDLIDLIWNFVECDIWMDGKIHRNHRGLVTGSNVSPMLSNLYLSALDRQLEEEGCYFVRFGDDYFILEREEKEAQKWKNRLEEALVNEYKLKVNKDKTGIFSVFQKKVLGYFFSKGAAGSILATKYTKPRTIHYQWQETAVEKKQNQYYLMNDGILSKRDWTLLFENEEKKMYLPVEVVDNINVYSDVIFGSDIFHYFFEKRVVMNLFDSFGDMVGRFVPESCTGPAKLMMKQVELYLDADRRAEIARRIEMASLHNLRSNLRYYRKKRRSERIVAGIEELTKYMAEMKRVPTIGDMMMTEARARQVYYRCLNDIIKEPSFSFRGRTRRPPRDAINALISFGNVFLYNEIAMMIRKKGLDIRVSIVHSANNRRASLNLDMADIFKPIIVDRVIFALVNRKEIRAQDHFREMPQGGIYLNREGKIIFLNELERKLEQKLMYMDAHLSYREIIREQISAFVRYLCKGEAYRPYKHI